MLLFLAYSWVVDLCLYTLPQRTVIIQKLKGCLVENMKVLDTELLACLCWFCWDRVNFLYSSWCELCFGFVLEIMQII